MKNDDGNNFFEKCLSLVQQLILNRRCLQCRVIAILLVNLFYINNMQIGIENLIVFILRMVSNSLGENIFLIEEWLHLDEKQ